MYSIITQYTYFCDNCSEMAVINQTDYYEEYDCSQCPFCGDNGMLMGCNADYAYDDIDCQLNYEDVIDFLEEEMPTKKQMAQWKKEISRVKE